MNTSEAFERPLLTVDVVLIRQFEYRLQIALHLRQDAPFAQQWALPGGFVFVNQDRDTLDAAYRMLAKKLSFVPSHLEQVCTVSGPGRDPRGWSASVVYMALMRPGAKDTDSPQGVQWFDIDALPAQMAFDHPQLVAQVLERLRTKCTYSTLLTYLLPETFVLPELHTLYQQVLGCKIDPANFRRKMRESGGLEELGTETPDGTRGRPGVRYRAKPALTTFDRTIA